MNSITDSSVIIQTSSESVPSAPSWFGEVTLLASYLRQHQVLTQINERVRFTRRRFGHYEAIDFLAILFGYAISGERTDGGRSTRACTLLRSPSWPCLSVTSSPLARRFRAF